MVKRLTVYRLSRPAIEFEIMKLTGQALVPPLLAQQRCLTNVNQLDIIKQLTTGPWLDCCSLSHFTSMAVFIVSLSAWKARGVDIEVPIKID